MTEEEESLVKGHSTATVSLGSKILHTDHCITLIHNAMDRAEK